MLNQVTLFGRLTKEPELRYSQSGMANVFVTIAVDRGMSKEKRQEAQANNQPTADFIQCKAFGKTAEMLGNYFKKGNRILVEGRIQTGSYEKEGQRVFTTDVIVNRVHFVESASENQGQQQPQGFSPQNGQAGYYDVDTSDVPF